MKSFFALFHPQRRFFSFLVATMSSKIIKRRSFKDFHQVSTKIFRRPPLSQVDRAPRLIGRVGEVMTAWTCGRLRLLPINVQSILGKGSKKKLGKSGQADRLGWPPPSPEAVRKMWKILTLTFDFGLWLYMTKVLHIYGKKNCVTHRCCIIMEKWACVAHIS